MVVVMGAAGDCVRRHLAVHVEVSEARPGGTSPKKKKETHEIAHSGSGKRAARRLKEWTDSSSSSVRQVNSCVSIKLWESVEQQKLIAKAAIEMKCPVYISHLLSGSVAFFQLFTLNIELLLPFNHF